MAHLGRIEIGIECALALPKNSENEVIDLSLVGSSVTHGHAQDTSRNDRIEPSDELFPSSSRARTSAFR